MKSMTGFGKSQQHNSKTSIEVSIKAVNGRYLDIKVHTPRIYAQFEQDIKKIIKKKFLRGTVEVYIHRQSTGTENTVVFNQKLADQWIKGFKVLTKKLRISQELSPELLLQIPDLFKIEDKNQSPSQDKNLLLKGISQAVGQCYSARETEGCGLKKDILQYVQKLKSAGVQLRKQSKNSQKNTKKRILDKLEAVDVLKNIDEGRLLQEIMNIVEKSDVSEELQRLDAHIVAIKKLTTQPGSIGKKLDFFAQELLREVNTIGSKSVSAAITQQVVDAKSLVEKYREQVQNIE